MNCPLADMAYLSWRGVGHVFYRGSLLLRPVPVAVGDINQVFVVNDNESTKNMSWL